MPPQFQQQQPPPQQQQGFQGQGGPISLQQAIMAINRANPGAPPNVMLGALKKIAPLLQMQDQMQLRQMMMELQQERLNVGQMGIQAKLAAINTQRQDKGLPPLTEQDFLSGNVPGGIPQQGTGESKQNAPQQGGQGDMFAGVDQGRLARANQLGWDRNALEQAGSVYQQTGKWPQGLGTRSGAQVVQGVIRDIASNINAQKGMTNQQMTAGWQAYHAEGKFQDTAGAYGARVENATNELKQLIPQAAQASKNWKRTDVVGLNKLWNEYKQGISDPGLNDLLVASFGVISAYTRAMNPSGAPRVNDRLETEAINLLSAANGPEAFMTQLRRMWKEAQASQQATYQTGKEGRQPGDINAPMPGDTGEGGIPEGWTVEKH
jgi:hypothetical protein